MKRAGACLAVLLCLPGGTAFAHEFYASRVPNRATAMTTAGAVKPCITCHDNPDGGAGCVAGGGTTPCLNPFGLAFRAAGFTWTPALAMGDADGDGFTNGQELQDPSGTWTVVMESPGVAEYVTRPGFNSSSPGLHDDDGDGYCWFGRDVDMNGDCLGAAENDGALDCNDGDVTVNSAAMEICTNAVDNDCNGLPTLRDPACAAIVDRDGDGFCPMGRDRNRDRDCIDAGENTADMDCDDMSITVFPGAAENCVDTLDNDCDGAIDALDSMCTGDADADMDGYCPIGRDLNGDGDCLDPGESDAGYDCDDGNADANPDRAEICTNVFDDDCDGLPDFLDTECRSFFDSDGDGHCPMGQDLNRDGNCAGEGEEAGEPDCNDDDPTISPSAMEVCTNTQDDDCDLAISLADDDCVGYLDADGDRYCFVGVDMNRDGDCADAMEEGGRTDCDDTMMSINPDAVEACTNGIDDDCDGSADGNDPECSDYLDADGDGWCIVGPDLDGDGTCDDEGEQVGPADAAPRDPTIYPGAPENCFDGKDNDQDGFTDMADAKCTRDTDADMDGWCPIGRDLNGDGDCLDAGENIAQSDCDDMDPARNPDAVEDCRNRRDDDCDGDIDLLDLDCEYVLDPDGDGVCGIGIDDNGDGDCLDESEDRFGEDCDNHDPRVNSGKREICDDMIDNNCDGAIDLADSRCSCDDAMCDDGDPCTDDMCSADGLGCEHPVSASCSDAGVDAGLMPSDGGGCGCSTPASSGSGWPLLVFGALALVWRRRR